MNHAVLTKVLIVDDNQAIHADFAKIFRSTHSTTDLDDLQRLTFSDPARIGSQPATYELEFAFQGAEALERVQTAARSKKNYALVFVDMRMPPGWDGLQTIEQLWVVDPALQVVICSAYSDYDWDYVLGRLNRPNNLLIVKKPFAAIEVLQSANALTGKWHSERELRHHLSALENTVQRRTASLEEINEQLREQMRLRQAVELELALAQKLEAVGRLAAGIAHEINTPIQYISDSVHFLGSAFADLLTVVTATDNPRNPNPTVDIAFLREEVPHAIERIIEGTQRVATIVRAMKDFAHPDASEKTASDLNRALETTLLIARNEYKYVATVDLQCGAIPEVMCNVGELSQVFLNLIVNAAHALADAGRILEPAESLFARNSSTSGSNSSLKIMVAAFLRTSSQISMIHSSLPKRSGAAAGRVSRSRDRLWLTNTKGASASRVRPMSAPALRCDYRSVVFWSVCHEASSFCGR